MQAQAKSDRVKIGTRGRASVFFLSLQFLHGQNRKSSLFVRVQLLRKLQHVKINELQVIFTGKAFLIIFAVFGKRY